MLTKKTSNKGIRVEGALEAKAQKTMRARPPETQQTDWRYRNTGYEAGVNGQGQVRYSLIHLIRTLEIML